MDITGEWIDLGGPAPTPRRRRVSRDLVSLALVVVVASLVIGGLVALALVAAGHAGATGGGG